MKNPGASVVVSMFFLVILGIGLIVAAPIPPAAAAGSGWPRAEVPPEAAPAVPPVFTHTVKPGESLGSLIYSYLPKTSYMTTAEFERALREANGNRQGVRLKPGEAIVIPGYEPEPVVEKPRTVPRDFEVRAIYLTGPMAGSDRGVEKIRRWHALGGNAVVFDIKDSDGSISIAFDHPLAPKHRPSIRNLGKFVRFLHSLDMHAIARIAIFRDELLVRRLPEMAPRSRRSGRPWLENGKLAWTDPSREEVQEYNVALARFAAMSGVDEVQFDYVRFPTEGDQKDAQFVFQSKEPKVTRADVINKFLERTQNELRATGVLFSLDVFGIMAWQRSVDLAHTGQDIAAMARYCDVLSPMIYPSHFFGMDGHALPGDAPAHFIGESMDRFVKITDGTGVILRPWLQAFAWKTRTYSPEYIRVQVEVAKRTGGIGFLFWNANNDYSKPFTAMPQMLAEPERFFQTVAKPEKEKEAKPAQVVDVAKSGGAGR